MTHVLSANRLTDGSVVYLTPSGDWSDRLVDAKVLTDGEREHARRHGQAAEDANLVVGSYEVAVHPNRQALPAHPERLRERIRSQGPTVNPMINDHQSQPHGGPEG